MSELISFLLGGIVFVALTLGYLKYAQALDRQKYRRQWEEAVQLLSDQGRLTEEQVRKIMPSPSAEDPNRLQQQGGTSSDRRRIEVARAKKKLPPADNLRGMTSSDIRMVREARIQYGTETE